MDSDHPAASKNAPRLDPVDLLAGPDPGILGIDNVRLDLPVAGIGSRMLAVFLDQIAILVLAAIWMVICMGLGALLLSFDSGMTAMWVVMALGMFLIDFAYYAVCEIKMDGRTPGKSVLGLRTVNRLGGQASIAAILVRNALRIFDYLIGTLMILLDRRHRRLGDLVASTLVIHDPVASSTEEARVGRLPAFFTPREIALVENMVRRIPSLLPERARMLSERFLAQVRQRDPDFVSGAPGEPQTDPVFELWRVFEIRAAGTEQG